MSFFMRIFVKINLGSAWRCQRKWVTGAVWNIGKEMERFFWEFHPLKKEIGKTWVIPFVCFPLNLETWESESTWTWLVTRFSILNLLKLLFGSKIYHPTVKQSEAFRLSEDDAADPCPNDTADPCDHGDAPRTDNDANPCGYGGEDATLPRQHCHSKLRKWLRRWGWYGMVWDGWGGCVTAFSWRGNVMIRKWYYFFWFRCPQNRWLFLFLGVSFRLFSCWCNWDAFLVGNDSKGIRVSSWETCSRGQLAAAILDKWA